MPLCIPRNINVVVVLLLALGLEGSARNEEDIWAHATVGFSDGVRFQTCTGCPRLANAVLSARACGLSPQHSSLSPPTDTNSTTDYDHPRVCNVLLSFQLVGAGAEGVTVTLDSKRVEQVHCWHDAGGEGSAATGTAGQAGGGMTCRAWCSNLVAAAGREARLVVTLVNAHGRAVSSPHVIPFVLQFATDTDSYHISVLPMRRMHGNRQKIPHALQLDSEHNLQLNPEHNAADDRYDGYDRYAGLKLKTRSEELLVRQECAEEEEVCMVDKDLTHTFHPPHLLDLSAADLPGQVHVGGLGNVSLDWPQGLKGPVGRAGVFKVVPISYAAYPEFVRAHPLPKVYDFAPYRPAAMSHYRHLTLYGPLEEAAYFDDYSRSYFGVTRRKAGWDCMRHYEILAAGAIPYFMNLSHAPANTMTSFPKALVLEAMSLPGVHFSLSAGGGGGSSSSSIREEGAYIDHAIFNHTHYFLLLRRLQQWTAHHLTTTALAQRLLRVMGLQDDSWHTAQVLYVVHPGGFGPAATYDEGGNLRDMLLHGLRTVLRSRLLDTSRIPHMYDDVFAAPPPAGGGLEQQQWEEEEAVERSGMHAYGFFHAGLMSSDVLIDRSEARVRQLLAQQAFDLVVVGSVCHDIIARRELQEVHAEVPDELPYWPDILRHYPPSKVALVDGDDWAPLPCQHWNCFCTCLRRYAPHGVYFWREMADDADILCA